MEVGETGFFHAYGGETAGQDPLVWDQGAFSTNFIHTNRKMVMAGSMPMRYTASSSAAITPMYISSSR